MLSHKKIILFPISHIKLCTILSWCRQHFHSALFYITLSLSRAFSLPVMVPSPFLLWCFRDFGFFSPLQTAGSLFYWRKGQRWWYFLSLEVILQKPVSPFTEDFPLSLPTILGDDEMRQLLPIQPSLLQQDTCSWVAISGVIPAGAWCQAAWAAFASLKHRILPIKYWDKTNGTSLKTIFTDKDQSTLYF